jgi:hypothetical protein
MNDYKPEELENLYSSLNKGISQQVQVLMSNGIETFESCEGGKGHSYPEPTIRFHGERSEGWKALSIALQHQLKVFALRRIWTVNDGEPIGAHWEMVFRPDEPLSG